MTARPKARRRGNSEGSIYRLADGRWRGSVFLGYRDGKPHRKYVTRRTRADVAKEVGRLVALQRQGALVTTGRITMADWLATYMDQVARPKVRPRTFERYQGDIARHIIPAIGRHRLDQLRPAHLLELYNAKAAEGLSGASLRHIHAVIRRALNVAVKWQLISVNPANLVDAPRPAQHEVIPFRQRQPGNWSELPKAIAWKPAG
jgi:integrase